MELWIANCTKQIKEIPYRLPGDRKMYEIKVNPGQQAKLPHSLGTEEIDHFLNQHKHYGLRDEKTVRNVKEHVGLLYAIDRKVDMNRITAVIQSNDDVLAQNGQKMLEQTLLASDQVVREKTEGQGQVNSIEIVEESPAGQRDKKKHRSDVRISGRRGSE